MKTISILFVLFLGLTYISQAQSDTLVINLKNNQVEKIAVSQIKKITFENTTAVDEQTKNPSILTVKGNYPNPVESQTSIEFELKSNGKVVVIIYDNTGNEIQKLECENCQAGKNTLIWNCLDKSNNKVQSGVYYYEVHYGKEVQTKKMILVK